MKIARFTITALVASLLLGSAEAPTHPTFGRKLGKAQKIEKYGYSIRIIERWSSVPQKPGVTPVVGSWQPDQEDINLRGDWSAFGCELKIVRFKTPGALTGSKEEIDKEKEKREKEKREHQLQRELRRISGSFTSRTLDEYLEMEYEGARDRSRPQTIKAGRSPRKLKGELLEFTKGSSFVLAALFKEPDWSWGVIYEAHEDYYKKEWADLYKKSLKSFQVFEAKGQVNTPTASTDIKSLPEDEKREAIKAGIAGNPGWWSHDTKNYVFLTNSENRRFILTLSKEIETIRAKVYEKMFPPNEEIEAICIVRVFDKQTEYYQYGGPYGSAGYWDSSKEELVLFNNFDQVSKARSTKYTKSVMYHEAFHQYIHYAVGDLAPHSWFNEGHGDYFAGMIVSGSRVSTKPFSWRVQTLKRRLSLNKGLIPIRSLVRLPQREYYSNAGLKYAQGWALVYFLRKVTKKKEWKAILDNYFTHLRDNITAFRQDKKSKGDTTGEPVEGIPGVIVYNFEDREKVEAILKEAIEKAFEGIDYEKLDEAYLKWIENL
ncbi:MAG: hypothetical protein VYE77_01830 [Planctomycetota bacterium]|nr:hypothetical protein [Planctomycetota bacterium]